MTMWLRRRRQLDVKIKITINGSYKSKGYFDSTYQAKNDKNENESIERVDNSNFSRQQIHTADKNKCRILIPGLQ
jgi:hypothetical protein